MFTFVNICRKSPHVFNKNNGLTRNFWVKTGGNVVYFGFFGFFAKSAASAPRGEWRGAAAGELSDE
jgi:hypothetical protein